MTEKTVDKKPSITAKEVYLAAIGFCGKSYEQTQTMFHGFTQERKEIYQAYVARGTKLEGTLVDSLHSLKEQRSKIDEKLHSIKEGYGKISDAFSSKAVIPAADVISQAKIEHSH